MDRRRYEKNGLIGIGVGFSLIVLALLSAFNFENYWFGLPLVYGGGFLGVTLFFWGFAQIPIAKGYSAFLCYLSLLLMPILTPLIWIIIAIILPGKKSDQDSG